MKIIYKIKVNKKLSAGFWNILKNNFDFLVNKKQHSIDGKTLNVDITIIGTKSK